MSKKMSYENYHKQISELKFEISYLKTSDMKDNEATQLKIVDLQRKLRQIEREYEYQV
ncbi:MAG: hypothetical protein KH100_06000 [Dysgonomonas mossii]|uniref:hypothetical protein n=1 Tax=Dysgonomonas mossii TaxID=163665 RepID=UPI001E117C63|nr:hypothetical protein [Dysgonomonas mossii]MBS5797345.1 hypothetical protein [Dysgonomonas mossii]MBS7110739.1 hypothetical protein [Dysgonomonas mossii]